jgi:hypothetical protein
MEEQLKKEKSKFFMGAAQKDIKENKLDHFFEESRLKRTK